MQLFKYLVSLLLIVSLLSFVDFNELLQIFTQLKTEYFILLTAISFVLFFFQYIRLHLLIYRYVNNLNDTAKLAFISQFFSNFSPGAVAGDIYKVYFLKKRNLATISAIAKVGLDRISGLIILLFASIIYFAVNYNQISQHLSINDKIIPYAFIAFTLLLNILFFNSKVKNFVIEKMAIIRSDFGKLSKQDLYLFLLVSLFVFFIRLLKFQIIFFTLNYDFNFFDMIVVVLFSQLGAILPISIGGLGVVEMTLIFGLSFFGVPYDIALVFAALNRVTIWIISAVGFFLWLNIRVSKKL